MLGGNAEPVPPGHHSAAVVAIDRWGNVAALVHSSNTPAWGDSGLVGDGIPVPALAGTYRYLLTQLAPGARVRSEMTPLIVAKDGKPALAVAAIGSSVVPETVLAATNLLAFLALLILSALKPQHIAPLFVPAILLCIATMASSGFYLFGQNWFFTILYADYTGFAYAVWLILIFGLLCDIALFKARVTRGIVHTLSAIVGAIPF